jgi:hypothetical protein
VAHRFPSFLDDKAEWERLVSMASKRGAATFIATANVSSIPVTEVRPGHLERHGMWAVVQWARTTRGGQQLDLLDMSPAQDACSSSYGLCG